MKKIIEIYRQEKDCRAQLKYYASKGLKIDKANMRAESAFLDITIIAGGKGLYERLEGLEADSVEMDYMPPHNVILLVQKIAKDDIVLMGMVWEPPAPMERRK